MSTGNGNKTTEAKATGLRFVRGRLILEFNDGREVSVPLTRYPTLLHARPAERAAWSLTGRGLGFHWKALDLDLSVRGLMDGLPEVIPAPPRHSRVRSLRSASR